MISGQEEGVMEDADEEYAVELIARYRVAGEFMETDQLPWADGALVAVMECQDDGCDPASGHRHFVRFLDTNDNLRAYSEMGDDPSYRYNGFVRDDLMQVSLEVRSLEFVGFLDPDGNIVDRNGKKITA